MLSKEKAAKVKVWEDIKKAHEADDKVEGVILNRVKGGFSEDIGVQAFLPGSQADLRPIRNLDDMVCKSFEFKILKYNAVTKSATDRAGPGCPSPALYIVVTISILIRRASSFSSSILSFNISTSRRKF